MSFTETPFAGLTALAPGESLSDNGYAFQFGDRYVIDRLLRLGAVGHRHDAAPALGAPTVAPTLTASASGGSVPADQPLQVCYTWLDVDGGETTPTPFTSVTTAASVNDPTDSPDVVVDYSAGTLLASSISYAVSLTDGLGGESMLGPPTTVDILPGNAHAQAIMSGLTALIADANPGALTGIGWRMWRQQSGGPWYLIGTGTGDTFTDSGLAGDCTVAPPLSSTVGGQCSFTVTVPAVPGGLAVVPVQFALYAALDSSFTSPALLGIYPIADAGTPLVFTDLTVSDGAPPAVNLSVPGATQIAPDSELVFGVKSSAADFASLPGTGNTDGDLRLTRDTHSLYAWQGTAWHPVLGPWLLPVPTQADLPLAPADGSVCVTLDTGDTWEYNATLVAWQSGNASAPVVRLLTPGHAWVPTQDVSFGPGTMADFNVLAGEGAMVVANNLLTTVDPSEVAIWGATGFGDTTAPFTKHGDKYAVQWTTPGVIGDNQKVLLYVDGWNAPNTGGSTLALVLGLADATTGLAFWVEGDSAGWTTDLSLLALDLTGTNEAALTVDRASNGTTGEGRDLIDAGPNPTPPPPRLYTNVVWDSAATAAHFWLQMWRTSDSIVHAEVYEADPMLGASPVHTSTFDATGTAYASGTTGYAGVVTSYLRDQFVGISELQVLEATTDYPYTLALADAQATLGLGATGAIPLTVPLNSDVPFPVGTTVEVLQTDVGVVTVGAASGVTVEAASALTTGGQWTAVRLLQIATDLWVVRAA